MNNSSLLLHPSYFPGMPLLPRNCKSYESRNKVTAQASFAFRIDEFGFNPKSEIYNPKSAGWEDAVSR